MDPAVKQVRFDEGAYVNSEGRSRGKAMSLTCSKITKQTQTLKIYTWSCGFPIAL